MIRNDSDVISGAIILVVMHSVSAQEMCVTELKFLYCYVHFFVKFIQGRINYIFLVLQLKIALHVKL